MKELVTFNRRGPWTALGMRGLPCWCRDVAQSPVESPQSGSWPWDLRPTSRALAPCLCTRSYAHARVNIPVVCIPLVTVHVLLVSMSSLHRQHHIYWWINGKRDKHREKEREKERKRERVRMKSWQQTKHTSVLVVSPRSPAVSLYLVDAPCTHLIGWHSDGLYMYVRVHVHVHVHVHVCALVCVLEESAISANALFEALPNLSRVDEGACVCMCVGACAGVCTDVGAGACVCACACVCLCLWLRVRAWSAGTHVCVPVPLPMPVCDDMCADVYVYTGAKTTIWDICQKDF